MIAPTDVFQGIRNDNHLSKVHLSKGYWQIPVCQVDIPKMAFVTMDHHCEFLRMPSGKMNSGATLTRIVKMLVRGMNCMIDYVDDILIQTPTWKNHERL
ncbi:retrovirus-related pol polyprotein from transposon opus [Plakobranchus ocellatus]|uniref:Retrovirus-related pol polyprotein from transposon opus n=1 Tax=Plakobranchus ocellatus TaxID=259542 RepID=A0AAV4CRD0_9GAST|nr:retrovirus-related pol polyprotein from transposon opus [Plakobranchus ocellatus]